MTAPTEPEAPVEATEGPSSQPARSPRRLDARIIAVCVCVAVVGALAAALITTVVLDDDPAPAGSTAIDLDDEPDPQRLLAVGLLTVDGKPTTLDDHLADQPLVVNIWAQSCVPCVDEMPLLEQATHDNPDLDFLGVDTQDDVAKAVDLAARTGITYDWVQDRTGTFFYEARGAGMPTTLIVAPSGRVLASKTGAFRSQSQLQGWLDEHTG